jgi:hypothetical protein
VLRKVHNALTWTPAEAERPDHQHVDCLIVGDSYADHVDMGFWCWPNMLAREHGISSLNAARGGSLCDQASGQIARAVASCDDTGLNVDSDTLLVLHSGGNNVLNSLILPPLWLFLLLDVGRMALMRAGLLRSPVWRRGVAGLWRALWSCSFIALLANHVAASHRRVLRSAHRHGFRRVLVAAPPICTALPLARAVMQLLTLGGASAEFIDVSLGELGGAFVAALRDHALPLATAELPGLRVRFFDEPVHLERLASLGGEHHHTVRSTARLVAARRAPTPATRFWYDGHHPTAVVHAELALACRPAFAALLQDSQPEPSREREAL